MGNEASRLDGVSPQGLAGGGTAARAGSSSRLPTTPISTPTGRRAKSFTSFHPQSPAAASNGNGNGASSATTNGSMTPRAAQQQNLQRQQSNPQVERTIQRMDKAIRKRVRGGITYNMKIIIRGEKGTGKTSLFHRLKGEPIPSEHETTPQLQSATINWNFRTNSEENVKCEVWDVVDRGFNPLADGGADGSSGDGTGDGEQNANPFELGALQSNSNFASVRASAAVAASIAGASGTNGSHTVATVDASTVDVYQETHGAIFLLDVTKWHTLEYVRQQLEKVPVHIPTLVLGNFRDCGNQRKIFKEDIQDLLYGSSDRSRQQQQLRRPHELLYFECSLLNCYGLKSLHQYFGIPFLQLKLATIRQQMRIVEGEFSHLKNDLQAKISEQRYSDYVEHIKSTGSDIRTGRKVPGGSPPAHPVENSIVVNGSARGNGDGDPEAQSGAARGPVGRSQSNASTGSDIVVVTEQKGERVESDAPPVGTSSAGAEPEREQAEPLQKDLDDLPERTHSLADQLTAPLKFAHSESISSQKDEQAAPVSLEKVEQDVETPAKASRKKSTKSKSSAAAQAEGSSAVSVKSSPAKTSLKTAADEPVSLEDFQVPKQKNNDLDSFYSDDDSDANGDSDEDVIVPPSAAMMKKYSHKQQFIYSDSSDSDGGEVEKSRGGRASKRSPRRRGVAKPVKSEGAVPAPPSDALAAASSSTQQAKPGAKPAEVSNSAAPTTSGAIVTPDSASSTPELHPQPPSSPSAAHSPPPTPRPISPAARTSRSPSPRQKLESIRSHSPKATHHDSASKTDDAGDEAQGEETEKETREAGAERVDAAGKEAVVTSNLESPSGQVSPRRHFQSIRSLPLSSPRRGSESDDERVAVAAAPIEEQSSATVVSTDAGERDSEAEDAVEVAETHSGASDADPVANGIDSPIAVAERSAEASATGDLEFAEDDEHVVLSDGMDNFFSDEDDASAVPSEAAAEEQVQKQPEPSISTASAVGKRSELLLSDDEGEDETREETKVVAISSVDDESVSDNDKEKEEVNAVIPAPSVKEPVPPAAMPRASNRPDMLVSDEESESEQEVVKIPVVSRVARPNRRPDMLLSDDDSDASNGRASAKQFSTVPQSGNTTQASSSISSPVETRYAPPSPSNDLESFFNDSDSEGEEVDSLGSSQASMLPSPPARAKSSKAPARRAMVASDDDDDDDESVDRFSSYNAKAARKSKAERKQEREEIRRMTASLSSSSLIEDLTPTATTIAPTANADVLAAIRLAQEEALRMLPPSDGASGDEAERSSRHKSKKKSFSSSSSSSVSRSKHSDDPSSSSARKKKSSSSSKSSSSRSSRRRDPDSGDERRESRRR